MVSLTEGTLENTESESIRTNAIENISVHVPLEDKYKLMIPELAAKMKPNMKDPN